MRSGVSRWALLAAIFVVMVVGDQWTKFLAVDRLTWTFPRMGATATASKVKVFYEALQAGTATLAQVTPQVLKWLAEQGHLERFLVRSAVR